MATPTESAASSSVKAAPAFQDNEQTRRVVIRLKRIAAEQPDDPELQAALQDHLKQVYAAVGNQEAAWAVSKSEGPAAALLLAAVQKGQVRGRRLEEARQTTRKILAILDKLSASGRPDGSGDLVLVLEDAAKASANTRDLS